MRLSWRASSIVGQVTLASPSGATIAYANGNKYKGTYRDGKRHGEGMLT